MQCNVTITTFNSRHKSKKTCKCGQVSGLLGLVSGLLGLLGLVCGVWCLVCVRSENSDQQKSWSKGDVGRRGHGLLTMLRIEVRTMQACNDSLTEDLNRRAVIISKVSLSSLVIFVVAQ